MQHLIKKQNHFSTLVGLIQYFYSHIFFFFPELLIIKGEKVTYSDSDISYLVYDQNDKICNFGTSIQENVAF